MMKWITVTILLIMLTVPAVAADVTVTAEKGTVGKLANFTITINTKKYTETTPIDAVLVMDCSGSMLRWGNIITDVSYVTITRSYTKVGEFKLDRPSDVEIMLQKPLDIYTPDDEFEAYIVNKDTGQTFPIKKGLSVVRWNNVPPGKYEVYARLMHCCCCKEDLRIFCVELPPERLTLVKSAAKSFVDLLKDNDRVAVVEFTSYGLDYWDYTKVIEHLTNDKNDVKSAIDSLNALGGTPMGYGLQLAIDELNYNGRTDANKVIILLSDGWWNTGPDPMVVVNDAIAHGYKIYTIGYGGADENTLKAIAEKTGGKYYYAANESDLKEIYSEIAKEIVCVGKNAVLKLKLTNVTFVKSDPDCTRNGNVLTWNIGDLKPGTLNFTVTVKATKEGTFKVADGWLNYTAPNGTEVSKKFEVYMTFVNHPPKIEVFGKTEIYELEWLDLTIRVTDPDGHAVSLSYVAPISGIFVRKNATTWELKWMPSSNFVESGTRTFTITFVAKDEYNKTAEKNVTVTVHDRQKWLVMWTDKENATVYEGNTTCIGVHVNSSSDYTITFDVENASNGTYVASLQNLGNVWTFYFTPQYDFTNSVKNVTVVFKAENKEGLTASASVNITVKNVNVTTWAKVLPKGELEIPTKGKIYVGEPIYLKITFINATAGNVTVNGVEIWRDKLTPPVDERTVIFVPNAAGEYRIVVWAINGSIATPTNFVPIDVSIKPIS